MDEWYPTNLGQKEQYFLKYLFIRQKYSGQIFTQTLTRQLLFADDQDIFSFENIKFFLKGLTDDRLLDVRYLDNNKYEYSLSPKAIKILDSDF